MKLDELFRLEVSGEITTINRLVGREGLTVTDSSPYQVRYPTGEGDSFYRWSISEYAAHSLMSKGVQVIPSRKCI